VKNITTKLIVFILIFSIVAAWIYDYPPSAVSFWKNLGGQGWPFIWQNLGIMPAIKQAQALNKTANWNFNGNSTGWTATNGTGTNTCAQTTASTTNNMATFQYNGALSGQTAFQATTPAVKNTDYRGNINQTFVAPGSGSVAAKGKFSYYTTSTNWGSGWIRVDIYDSTNATHVASLDCVTFSANTAWTTRSFGSDVSLSGGTTYTIRVTMQAKTKSNSNTAITLGVDNIVVNLAPTGLSGSAVAGTTNVSLSWTASTAGSGANGLHGTTPYKVYRDVSSPVATFRDNATTNSYTDTSTQGNTNYYYAVSDVDTASDESPLSAETSPAILTCPDQPTSLNFTNVQAESLRLNWSAPTGGADSYKIERCEGSGCTNFSQIQSGETDTFYDDSSLTCNTLYRYQVRATNNSGDGAYSSIAEQTTGACGSLGVDIVDSGGSPVPTPSMAMDAVNLSFTYQTATGSFGTVSEQIRVTNTTASPQWTLSVAALATAVWDSAGTDYDFNDPTAGANDGGDTDTVGGQLTVNPAVSTITPQGGCSTTGLTKGSATAFSEGVTDTITLVTAGPTAESGCYWDITGIGISQTIPKEQPVASDYDINMTISAIAS
jgi:hypothetical protein